MVQTRSRSRASNRSKRSASDSHILKGSSRTRAGCRSHKQSSSQPTSNARKRQKIDEREVEERGGTADNGTSEEELSEEELELSTSQLIQDIRRKQQQNKSKTKKRNYSLSQLVKDKARHNKYTKEMKRAFLEVEEGMDESQLSSLRVPEVKQVLLESPNKTFFGRMEAVPSTRLADYCSAEVVTTLGLSDLALDRPSEEQLVTGGWLHSFAQNPSSNFIENSSVCAWLLALVAFHRCERVVLSALSVLSSLLSKNTTFLGFGVEESYHYHQPSVTRHPTSCWHPSVDMFMSAFQSLGGSIEKEPSYQFPMDDRVYRRRTLPFYPDLSTATTQDSFLCNILSLMKLIAICAKQCMFNTGELESLALLLCRAALDCSLFSSLHVVRIALSSVMDAISATDWFASRNKLSGLIVGQDVTGRSLVNVIHVLQLLPGSNKRCRQLQLKAAHNLLMEKAGVSQMDSVMNLLLKAVQECVNHMDDLERFFILSLVELSFERYSAKRDNKTTDQFVKLVKDVQHKLKEPGAFNQVITRCKDILINLSCIAEYSTNVVLQ